ncbi:MAG: LysE family transporter [Bacteroidales bacterium]|nr:LysE family transporter [Bacteroidales bacterium]
MLIVFLKGLIVGLGASIPLGPVGVLCIQKTLSKGRMAGFITGLGASISGLIYSALSLLGLFLIDDFIEKNKALVLIIGGVVIVLIGIRIYTKNPIKSIRQKNTNGKRIKDLAESLAITMTNPGSIFLIFAMLAAVRLDISSYSPEEASTVVRILLVAIFLGSALWWFSLSTLVNIFRKKFRLRQLIAINRIAGILIIVLGVISLAEGLIKLVLV